MCIYNSSFGLWVVLVYCFLFTFAFVDFCLHKCPVRTVLQVNQLQKKNEQKENKKALAKHFRVLVSLSEVK